MCVIIISEKTFPSLEMLEAANTTNDDGIGIAWREGSKVYWDKGIDFDELKYYQYWAPAPWVFHFRLRTHGSIGTELCHPFSVDKRASVDQFGSADAVLFHNGIYNHALDAMKAIKQRRPGGDWSDTRAMAWLAGLTQSKDSRFEFFKKSQQKLVYFSGEELVTFGSGWTTYEGHLVSNRMFLWRVGEYDDDAYQYYGWGRGATTPTRSTPMSNLTTGLSKEIGDKRLLAYHEAWCRETCFCGINDGIWDETSDLFKTEECMSFDEEWRTFVEETDEDHYQRVVESLAQMGITDEDMIESRLSEKQIQEIRNLIYEEEDLMDESAHYQSELESYMIEGCS